MKIRVRAQFKVAGSKSVFELTDALLGELVDTEGGDVDLSEADVHGVGSSRLIAASVVVRASSWEEAETRGMRVIRDAIRAIGGTLVERIAEDTTTRTLKAAIQSTELVPA